MKLADLGNRLGGDDGNDASNKDTRIAYGACCTWWDDIHKVGTIPAQRVLRKRFGGTVTIPSEAAGLPCCPHCRGMLFEMENEAAWFASVDKYESEGHPGYRRFAEWMRGKCFPSIEAAQAAYALDKPVQP